MGRQRDTDLAFNKILQAHDRLPLGSKFIVNKINDEQFIYISIKEYTNTKYFCFVYLSKSSTKSVFIKRNKLHNELE